MTFIPQNQVFEWSVCSNKSYTDPMVEVELYAAVTDPTGQTRRIPAFWSEHGVWRFRYSSSLVGLHSYHTECSDIQNTNLHMQTGVFTVTPNESENPLFEHGAIGKSADNRTLQHADGTPFFWLADTWWMGLTTRLAWPDDFMTLTSDRVEKGFTVVQIIAGLYPDMDPFDARGANEAGFPWETDFSQINPAYFDAADKKITHLIEEGITPCIVGCWGFFTGFAGVEKIKRHWDYLLARWAAYPVVWCIAGEANMAFYNDEDLKAGRITVDEYVQKARKEWTEITAYVRSRDPFKRLVTIHPTQNGHEQLEDEKLLDLDMLQTGHGGPFSLLPTIKQVRAAVERKAMPVLNAEVCYEGICGSSGADVQRYLFWACVLTGCCGHTYAANGIWQLNTIGVPYGPSPHGATWGDTPWQEACKLPGSLQIGNSKKFLTQYPWWRFEPHPEWVENPCNYENLDGFFSAGIPGEVILVFRPFFGGAFWGEETLTNLEPGLYKAICYYPITNQTDELGTVSPDENGKWRAPRVRAFGDSVLVLQKI